MFLVTHLIPGKRLLPNSPLLFPTPQIKFYVIFKSSPISINKSTCGYSYAHKLSYLYP